MESSTCHAWANRAAGRWPRNRLAEKRYHLSLGKSPKSSLPENETRYLSSNKDVARQHWESDRIGMKRMRRRKGGHGGERVCARRQRASKAGRHRGIDRMNATPRTRYSASNLDDQTSDSSYSRVERQRCMYWAGPRVITFSSVFK